MNEDKRIQEFLVRWYITWGMNPVDYLRIVNEFVDTSYSEINTGMIGLEQAGLMKQGPPTIFTLTPKAIELIKERLNE